MKNWPLVFKSTMVEKLTACRIDSVNQQIGMLRTTTNIAEGARGARKGLRRLQIRYKRDTAKLRAALGIAREVLTETLARRSDRRLPLDKDLLIALEAIREAMPETVATEPTPISSDEAAPMAAQEAA